MRWVFDTMGTTVSLSAAGAPPVDEIIDIFERADRLFSLYSPASELSRLARGELRLEEAGPELRSMYVEAVAWRSATDGGFSPHRPDGVIDLNGIVKAAAMREAATMLDASGCGEWALVVGGDVVVSAGSDHVVGIVDPANAAAILCSVVLAGGRRAVATSGSAERGDHIWLGGELRPSEFVQVSVLADDIVTADVLATAIVAAGPAGLDDLCDRWPIDVLTVDRQGGLRSTPGFSAALAPAGVT